MEDKDLVCITLFYSAIVITMWLDKLYKWNEN